VRRGEVELLGRNRGIRVDFVGDYDDRDVGAVMSHLLVPFLQVLVSDLPSDVKTQNAAVRLEVIGRVQLVELLLSRRVPEVDLVLLVAFLVVVTKQRQGVGGQCSGAVVL